MGKKGLCFRRSKVNGCVKVEGVVWSTGQKWKEGSGQGGNVSVKEGMGGIETELVIVLFVSSNLILSI